MKKIGTLFEELGFKKDASLSVQRAFIKHLVQAADRPTQQNQKVFLEQATPKYPAPTKNEQLTFDPEILKAGNE